MTDVDPLPPWIREQLVNVFGAAKAEELTRELLREAGLSDALEPDRQLALGEALLRRGGVLAAIGRSVRVRAYLVGAGS